ncbi:MAG: hypothetical protein M1822_007683 [Bathelium mastoideum]|nr:MAG: hypothetical protein M1822_007683 [Bathelium mastoideum]
MSNGDGSITANSREQSSDTSWYVFDNVNVTSQGTGLEGDVYLGRPWRVLARVMYQNSYLSSIINAAGWTTMAADATPLYYEYKNTGPGASTSSRKYETSASGPVSIETVLGSDYTSWVDTSAANSPISADASTLTRKSSEDSTRSTDAATCTPSSGGSASTDDTPAITTAIKSCGQGGTIVIPAGKTYYLNSVLDFTGCDSCDFQIEGTLRASNNLNYWEGKTAIIYLKDITAAKVRSVTGSGIIDGNGQAAWDEFSTNSSYRRPTLVYTAGGSDITFGGFSMVNPPNVFHSANGGASNIVYTSLNLSAISTSKNPAHNTDGFDVGPATYVTYNNIVVLNDDDCIAFKSGASYITVDGITCTGSHGLSVGSLGESSNDSVTNIYVSNATMINSAKAVGIKTYPSGDGHGQSTVTNVTYTGIKVQGSDYAIQIQSCYNSDASYCSSNPGNAQISDVVFADFSGTTSKTDSPATSNLDCGAKGKCGIKIEGYDVAPPSGTGKVLCANTPSDLGVACSSDASG